VLVFVARGARALNERRRGLIRITYPDGKTIRVPRGLSVLESSWRFNIPHASVCGGRGRCSTCRIRIIGDRSALPAPSPTERAVLERAGFGPDSPVRLACQLRRNPISPSFRCCLPMRTCRKRARRCAPRAWNGT
jgi:adenylate cyclase